MKAEGNEEFSVVPKMRETKGGVVDDSTRNSYFSALKVRCLSLSC